MARNGGTSFRDPQPLNVALEERDSEVYDLGEDVSNPVQDNPRRWESSRKRAWVLVGSALLQLPIWGWLTSLPHDSRTLMLISIGFAMTYGVFQEYYTSNQTLQGNYQLTGIIGTTSNGVMYLSMPFLFGLYTKKWARRRQVAALGGTVLACMGFLLSSFSTDVWHLVATQGVLVAFGCTLMYSPTTLSLGEWFNASNRAVAYGIVLSSKNLVGSTCPFLIRALLDRYGFRVALRIWTAIVAGTSIVGVLMVPTHPSSISSGTHQTPRVAWRFLRHQTFYIYSIAIILQSSGYGIPQTYLNTYAHDITLLSQTSATLLLTLFNVPGIVSSAFFGYLSDNKHYSLSASTVTAISAVSSALSAFIFWGLTSQGSFVLLLLFSMTFGFFAGGYSATWGGVMYELEREAAQRNEAINSGLMYGLLNGARGIGYVSGGLVGVPLLRAGPVSTCSYGYGTSYGALIIFTGLSTVFGGWGLLWKWKTLVNFLR